jgi:hypothetical protein
MDYAAVGRKIVLDCWPQFSWWPKEELAKIGRAAVEAVNEARPAPQRVKMMIDEMTEDDIRNCMASEPSLSVYPSPLEPDIIRHARVANRLATTPKPPAVDPDERAKEMYAWFISKCGGGNFLPSWEEISEPERVGWRAVAAMEGK